MKISVGCTHPNQATRMRRLGLISSPGLVIECALVHICALVRIWTGGWSGGAKVLRHRGVRLILACSWTRPTVLVAGKNREGLFLFLLFLQFISVPLSSLFLSFISSTISSISLLPFSGRRHKMPHKAWRVVKPQHNQSYMD